MINRTYFLQIKKKQTFRTKKKPTKKLENLDKDIIAWEGDSHNFWDM